jgi:plasmid stabilization system protein ParE
MIIWRPNALSEVEQTLRYLRDRDDLAARRFLSDVDSATRLILRRPRLGRPSRYPGFRAWSLVRWSKLVIFRETTAGIEIAALLDTRQLPPKTIK